MKALLTPGRATRYIRRMTTPDLHAAAKMLEYIDAGPTSYHACAATAEMLDSAGFSQLRETDSWQLAPGNYYVIRGGSLVAWSIGENHRPHTGFRVLGAHTDSPGLRVKPRPDTGRAGWRQLGVEVYGGPLLNSWIDRDLGLSGRVQLRGGDTGKYEKLFAIDRPILKIPQLAIHLDSELASTGLKLNAQNHLVPVWGLGDSGERGFRDWLASEIGVEPGEIISWEAMCHDVNPSTFIGVDENLVSAPRLDNLCSSFCATRALLSQLESGKVFTRIPVVVLFDHEEVGSSSTTGAGGPLLRHLLERIILAGEGGREDLHRAVADSLCISIDMAHATHPNYVDKHEPDHHLFLNKGPVIKINANLRYASESSTEAEFQLACERAGVPVQKWVNRTDLRCGSTIGPMTASGMGIATVDVGNAQLGMHSIRETCGAHDPGYMIGALEEILT
jgi:aspartyl aminopeptidase